jgi:hypothetical protein
MSDEALQVLEMLAAGKLTVDEADELLAALTSPSAAAERSLDQVLGFAPAPAQGAVLRSIGADATYIAALQAAFGYPLRTDKVIALKSIGVTAGYIAALRAGDFTDLDADQVIALRGLNVPSDYVRALRDAGLTDLTPERVIALWSAGVTAEQAAGIGRQLPDPLDEPGRAWRGGVLVH